MSNAQENPMFLRSQELYSAFILFCCLTRVLSFVPMKAVRQFSKIYVPRSRVNFHSSSFLRAAKLLPGDTDGIHKAAIELQNGHLVAFPTETVYGLGAHAFNADAVQQIFVTKQRPNSDPLIVHVSNTDMINELYDFHGAKKAASVCKLLTTTFWPGPLTIIFKAQPQVPSVITAGTGFVGVRCPKHPIALALIHEAGIPIAAPSANRFGHVSPTSAKHVLDDLGHSDISIIADDTALTGGCSIGVESTVCRISKDGRQVSILRCGAVTVNMLQEALGSGNMHDCEVIVDNERHLKSHKIEPHTPNSEERITTDITASIEEAAVAPGQMLKHYAPDIPTFIVRDVNAYISTHSDQQKANNNAQMTSNDIAPHQVQTAMVIDFGGQLSSLQHIARHYIDLSSQGSAAEACVQLFDVLRRSESEEVRQMGVTHVLLPDLSHFSHPAAATGSASCPVEHPSENKGSNDENNTKGRKLENDGLRSALWERMHRAASGIFI